MLNDPALDSYFCNGNLPAKEPIKETLKEDGVIK